ncbi:MAG: binding-protein-dependent transport system inner rane component [Paenibacillus sp.]|nr:binding-protein-dependent transport system inner rane component [Paenibacillus sp.]
MSKRFSLKNGIIHILLILGGIVMLMPFYWMVATSLKSGGNVTKVPPQWIPNPIDWSYYSTVWIKVDFARYTFNSFFIVTLDVIGTLLSCAMVAFGLAMFNFKLKKTIYLAMLSTLMLPAQVTMIPGYFIWKSLGGLDTYMPLIVPSFLAGASVLQKRAQGAVRSGDDRRLRTLAGIMAHLFPAVPFGFVGARRIYIHGRVEQYDGTALVSA